MTVSQPTEDRFLRRFPDPILTVDSHTHGEPTRLVVDAFRDLPGTTMAEKRDYFMRHFDRVRCLLTREPRGHRGIMGAVVTGPVTPGARFGLLFMDARRYPYLCGHATIGAVATLVETGSIDVGDGTHTLTVDTPSGPMDAVAKISGGRVDTVAIRMVPSFVQAAGVDLGVDGYGNLPVDLVCVGGFFAMISADAAGISLEPDNRRRLVDLGMAVIDAANRAFEVRHPLRPEVATVDVTEFHAEDPERPRYGRSVVIYGESHMDRSPCGTGTTAKMTLLHHLGRLALHEPYVNESPLGTSFEGRLVASVPVGNFQGVVGEIRGSAQIIGRHEFVLDPRDPFPEGFLL